MITHVVLFRIRPDLSNDEREALLDAFEHAVRHIETVRGVRAGRRESFGAGYERPASESFEYLIAIDFDDLGGLQHYLQHPAHVELGERFNQACAAAMVCDFSSTQDVSRARALFNAQ
jgi:hypothetical protein